jgi:uncharacterized protein (DUF362 family)
VKAKSTSPLVAVACHPSPAVLSLNRRAFLQQSLALAGGCALGLRAAAADDGGGLDRLKPIGKAKGIHPGRVVWAHDAELTDWKGAGDGHWWAGKRIRQERLDAMLARSVCSLTGESTVSGAWARLFRHQNQARGKGDVGYQPGERIMIKPNWVGLIYREGHANTDTYRFNDREDYMNTAPQMILAVMHQLESAGVRPKDITVGDTLACLIHEYYDLLHGTFSEAHYEDCAGKFERIKAAPSDAPLFWSCRPAGKAPDRVPKSFAGAEYVINFANLKAHTAGGVTLCAKNHYGSLVRWPVQQGYYDMHPSCFSTKPGIYRPLVDLMGHAHLGGKTVLCLVDGLFSGVHPRDPVPQPMRLAPFDGHWPCSLLASQDPVAIDSVGFDFLWSERTDFPRKGGVDDYLHEAALASDPPSGTFYDPNHATPTTRLSSLGAHEHWNNPEEKKYSRNLGIGAGIELVKV